MGRLITARIARPSLAHALAARCFAALALLAVSVVASCSSGGDDGGTGPGPTPLPTLGSVVATPATVSALEVGGTVTIAVHALDTQGAAIAGASGFTFSSSSNTVATVSSSGVVQGVAAGTANITVSLTLRGVTRTATVPVTVVARTLGSIAVAPATISSLSVGANQQLTVQAFDTQGAPMAGATGYVYLSGNESIVTVSATGVVRGVSAGSTVIVVSLTMGAVIATATIDVTVVSAQQVLGSITAAPSAIGSLAVGSTQALTMQALTPQGAVISGASGYVFTSSNESVATVSAQGVVTGVSAGTATVTVTLTLNAVTKSTTVGVTVVAPPPFIAQVRATTGNIFTPSSVEIARGGSVVWTFEAVAHNVTFAAGAVGAPTNIPDTANSRDNRTFGTAGTFTYTCTLHAGMTGTVIVR